MGALTSRPKAITGPTRPIPPTKEEHPDAALRQAFEALTFISGAGTLALTRTPKTFTIKLSRDNGKEICRFRGESLCHALQGLIKRYLTQRKEQE